MGGDGFEFEGDNDKMRINYKELGYNLALKSMAYSINSILLLFWVKFKRVLLYFFWLNLVY